MAENHAFLRSYNDFYNNGGDVNIPRLKLKNVTTPGIYYWHYHFNGKRLPDSANTRNTNHVFFGIPVVITPTDITNAEMNNQSLTFEELEKYNDFENKYTEYVKTLKR